MEPEENALETRGKEGRVMDVEINNRLEYCRDTCPYAEIRSDVEEYKALGGTCMVLVTIECAHSGVCCYEHEGGGE